MADLTLSDIAKEMPDSKAKGAIWTYALANHVTRTMPLETQPTGVKKWSINHDLAYTTSANATRVFNGEFTASKTIAQPFVSNVKLYGGRVQYDRALMKLNPAQKAKQEKGQVIANSNILMKDVFEGAGGQYLRGIQNMIDTVPLFSDQVVLAGTISTPAVLSMDIMDDALAKQNVIPGRTFIYCNNAPFRRIKKMARGQGGSTAMEVQNINYGPDQLGYFAGFYDNIPIIATVDGKGDDILSNAAGGGLGTTVYIVTYGEDNFTGFKQSDMEMIDMDGVSVTVAFDLELMIGTAAQSKRCITMIKYVKNDVS